jgi:hypothetical protein
MWPFKRKKGEIEIKLDELLERVGPEVKANGGFVIIGLATRDGGNDGIQMGMHVHKQNKHHILFGVAKDLNMDLLEVLMTMVKLSPSKVSHLSPLQRKDLNV